MTPISEYLTEQKRLAEAATPGKWERSMSRAIESDLGDGSWAIVVDQMNDGIGAGVVEPADAEFIAAARSSVPKLISALEAVMAVRDLVSRPGDAPHVLSTIAGYNRALTVVRAGIEAALGGEGE